MKNMFNVITVLLHNLLQTNPCIRHNFSTQVFRKHVAQLHIFWPPLEARKCSAAQGPHSEVVLCAFWRLVSKSCGECKGSFARGCEAKRWSHWTCSSLGTIFQTMRINSVPGVKCFCNNKNVLLAQSMVWHFVHHSVCTTETHLRILRVEGTATVRKNHQKYLTGVPLVRMLAYLQTFLWAAASTTVPCSPEHHSPLQMYVVWWQGGKSRRLEHLPLHGI